MRVALLVLAHREPDVLRHSIPLYKTVGFDIFVHLDCKVDKRQYVERLGPEARSCSIIDRRTNVFWGGFSMVEAELALIFAAIAHGQYDRYVLVSDDTFPIVPGERLLRLLSEDLDRVMLRKLEPSDPFSARYTGFYHFDHPASALQGRPIESAAIDDEFLADLVAIQELKKHGKKLIDVYYGSQWWAITASTMTTILQKLDADRHLFASFKYSAVPDELLFQTLVGNYVDRSRVRSGIVYVEWAKDPRPYIFKSVAEIQTIPSDFCLIRKLNSGSVELLASLSAKFS